MTPENSETFKTPSQLRIHQRLGQLRSNEVIREKLFPKIEHLGGLEITAGELVGNLVSHAHEVANDPDLIVGVLAYNYVPKFINILVDEQHQDQAFEAYAEMLEYMKQLELY